ncbi:MAG: ABC transporter ATP-binding protein, partial [Hyphomicrobiaceae bacterium]|nr:ABC transporter ATP-binding protein [Hyphomicrobiaceae bacterium]
ERRAAAERRAEVAPLRRAMQKAEAEVEKLGKAIQKIDDALADPDIYVREAEKAKEYARQRGLLTKELSAAEDAWMAATEAYEEAASST